MVNKTSSTFECMASDANGCTDRNLSMIPVESHYLYSIRQQASFSWKSMVCELIDNSFGADADFVKLSWPGGKAFTIEDNGNGTDDLMKMLTLGAKRDRSSRDIGYYGVGAKLALIWLWGKSRITSVCGAGRYSVEIDWSDIAEGLAGYPDEDSIDIGSGFSYESGTIIQCFAERNYPKFDDLFASISNTYTPGIEDGRSIVASLNNKQPVKLKAREWPQTTEQIDDVIVAAGREVRIRMGIVAPGVKNTYRNGFAFERSFRVIKECLLGSGSFGASRIAARITLGQDWLLSTNKDEFTEYQDELTDAIFDRCQDLLKTADEQSISYEDQQFNKELAAIVSQANRRESRPNKGSIVGSVEPASTGRKRTSAKVSTDENGSVAEDADSPKRKRRGFDVVTYEDDSATFGKYDRDANKVCLNISNEWLAEKHRERDDGVLTAIIYGILADSDSRRDGEKTPLLRTQIEDDFCATWGANVERVCKARANQS
jgi:hypothetical protein